MSTDPSSIEELARELQELKAQMKQLASSGVETHRHVDREAAIASVRKSVDAASQPGPSPDPELIEKLERVRPGLGVRLLDDHHALVQNTIDEALHRRGLEAEDQRVAHAFFKRGQDQSIWSLVVATVLSIAILSLAFFMAWRSAYKEAAALVTVGIAAVVAAFWAGGRKRQPEPHEAHPKA